MLVELLQSSPDSGEPQTDCIRITRGASYIRTWQSPLLALVKQPVWDGAWVVYYFKASQRTVKKSRIRDHWSQNLNLLPFV